MQENLPNQNLSPSPQSTGVIPNYHYPKAKRKTISINKLMLSTYFRIGLTFLLMIMLFVTASFIAFQSEQKRKALEEYEVQIPDAEIIIPETETPTPINTPVTGEGCVIGGCNGEICRDADKEPLASICRYQPWFACYDTVTCERQEDGECDWTQTEELTTCLSEYQENE